MRRAHGRAAGSAMTPGYGRPCGRGRSRTCPELHEKVLWGELRPQTENRHPPPPKLSPDNPPPPPLCTPLCRHPPPCTPTAGGSSPTADHRANAFATQDSAIAVPVPSTRGAPLKTAPCHQQQCPHPRPGLTLRGRGGSSPALPPPPLRWC